MTICCGFTVMLLNRGSLCPHWRSGMLHNVFTINRTAKQIERGSKSEGQENERDKREGERMRGALSS